MEQYKNDKFFYNLFMTSNTECWTLSLSRNMLGYFSFVFFLYVSFSVFNIEIVQMNRQFIFHFLFPTSITCKLNVDILFHKSFSDECSHFAPSEKAINLKLWFMLYTLFLTRCLITNHKLNQIWHYPILQTVCGVIMVYSLYSINCDLKINVRHESLMILLLHLW